MEYILSKKYDTPELQALIMGPNPVKLEEEAGAQKPHTGGRSGLRQRRDRADLVVHGEGVRLHGSPLTFGAIGRKPQILQADGAE